jgi:hypothetical protein
VVVGTAAVGSEFSLRLDMVRPPEGTTAKLNLPPVLMVVGGATKSFAPGPDNLPASVTWKVRGRREGTFPFAVTLSSGGVIRASITVKPDTLE